MMCDEKRKSFVVQGEDEVWSGRPRRLCTQEGFRLVLGYELPARKSINSSIGT